MKRRGGLVLLLVAVVLLGAATAGCGSSRAPGTAKQAVVVDTDLGSDDVIALLYLLRDPSVDLRAVAVSGTGLVHCPAGARNAAALLALVGRSSVPVACGRSAPLAGFATVPEDWRRAADSLFGLELPPAARPAPEGAVSLLRRHAPGATVLELAPMTNLAAAFRSEPGLAGSVDRVVAMAGAVDVPGNAPGHDAAETNAWLDPVALRTVLRSGVPLTLVPLDATNDVPITTYVAEALRRYHYATAEATAVWDLVGSSALANGGSYFWDPLAAAAVAEPSLLTTSERRLDVVTSGDGAGRLVPASTGMRTRIATGADRGRFERELLRTLLGGAPFVLPPARPTATVTWDGTRCSWDGPRRLTAGKVVLDAVDASDQPFQWVVAGIRPPHTLADLKAYVAALSGPPDSPPPWLILRAGGSIPPRSTMTFVAWAESGPWGSVVVACTTREAPYAAIAASLPVYASR